MKHIADLYGIGHSKQCLIVGGGASGKDIDYDSIPDHIDIISCNRHASGHAKYLFYYEKEVRDALVKEDAKYIIGFKHSDKLDHTNDLCSYYYTYADILYGDTGFHTLQFMDRVFCYSDIHIIGYDYMVNDGRKGKNKTAFKTHSIGRVLPRYDITEWRHYIYNLNGQSALKRFPYKTLQELQQ